MPLLPDRPAPLTVAASLTALEGVVVLLQAVAELVAINSDRLTMALTTTAFFIVYGGALLACAWALARLNSWARSPVVMAQLIQVGVGFSFWGGDTRFIAIVLFAVAAVVLAGVLHPASIDALADEG